MSEGNKPSIEEILATCRRLDQGRKSGARPAESPQPKAEINSPAAPELAAAEAAQPVKESQPQPAAVERRPASQMSVEEVLAAARRKPGQAAATGGAQKPAEAKAAPAKTGAQMSVEEVLAAARRGAAAAKPAESPAAKAPQKTAAAAAEAKPAAPERKTVPVPADTASILAAARAAAKPGPISKAEAAARAKAAPAEPAKPKALSMPERPAYLQPRPKPEPAGPSRRSFFGALVGVIFGSSLAVGFASLFVTNLLWLLGLARFMFPNILTEPPTVFKVGYPDDYAPGQVETRFVAQFGVWIVRYEYQGQPQIFALRTVCTHLGCTPNWLEAEQKFKCPCHGSGFYKDGINFEGPAPRPLERYAIRIAEDGQLEVDKSRRFQEELGQWKDPASFVPV